MTTLVQQCIHEFTAAARSQGERLFQQGDVYLDVQYRHGVEALVADSTVDHEVELDWSTSGEMFASCSCDDFAEGESCKHLWATILAADAGGVAKGALKRERLTIVADDESDYAYDDDDWDDFGRGASFAPRGRSNTFTLPGGRSAGSKARGKKAGGKGRQANWRRQLRPPAEAHSGEHHGRNVLTEKLIEKTREAWFVLDVGASLEEGGLVVALFQRETKKNGEFGKVKQLSLDRDEIERFTHALDRELLELLLINDDPDRKRSGYGSYGYYGYQPKTTDVLLAPAAYEYLLPKLCAHERFVWLLSSDQPVEEGRRVAWDDGEPWRFRVHVEADDAKQEWTLTGRLVRSSESEPVPLDRPVLLVSYGAVLFEDRLARLDIREHMPWVVPLRRDGAVRVPYRDRDAFLEYFWQLPSRPEIDLPERLRWSELRTAPRGRLQVHPPDRSGPQYGSQSRHEDRLYGNVAFDYEGRQVPVTEDASGIVDPEHERVLVRDPEAERRLLRELSEAGVRPHTDWYRRDADVVLSKRKLANIVDRLVQAGWIVEAEGQLVRRPGDFRLNITSGVDWFELSGEFDFEGESVRLPDLLAALRKGEKYVRLGDGSQGLLPEEWLARYGALADLGQTEGDGVRFRPSQAMLLDALLAAQPQVSIDGKFANFRKKLHSFEGVRPRSEPRGFVGSLRDYQKTGLGWLRFLQEFGFGGCLADDMGLGKTVQVLALLQLRRTGRSHNGRAATSLAVVPRSLIFNWIEEAARFAPNLRVLDYTGIGRKEYRDRLDQYDLVLTTYGTLRRDIVKLKDVPFDYVILDEAQAIKNAGSQAAKACRLLQAEHRLALTGTPIENHLGELWSLFEFLNPGMLGKSSAFQTLTKQSGTDQESLRLLSRALTPFILRRTKEQVLSELPEKTEQTLHCELSTKERKQYNDLRDYYRARLTKQIEESGFEKSKIHVLEALLRLRQAACHPGLLDKQQADQKSAKFEALLGQLTEVIDEGHKVLVFSQFTSLLAILRRRLDEQRVVYEYLDGRTRDRQEPVRRFQEDPDCRVFLISLKAGGHGLNLTAADYVFILDPWWNPAVEAQAIDRAHRIGQSRRVFAYRLIARDTVEEKIVELQQTKRDLADAILANNESLIRRLSADDLKLLLS